MEVRFQHVPGLKKVQRNEYAVQEMQSKRNINLKAPWEAVFLPGRKFIMSMTFRREQDPVLSCPGCQTENAIQDDNAEASIQWSGHDATTTHLFMAHVTLTLTSSTNPNCNLWYQRVVEVHSIPETRTPPLLQPNSLSTSSSPGKRTRADDQNEDKDGDEIQHFRRVQVILQRFRRERSQNAGVVRKQKADLPRPKRNAKKRTYGDSSFEGYGEGFVDDDTQETGYSTAEGDDRAVSRKRPKKVCSLLSMQYFNANKQRPHKVTTSKIPRYVKIATALERLDLPAASQKLRDKQQLRLV
jgi:hypothetical protein